MEKLKFVFFGTPTVASQTLDILAKNGYVPSIIITSPDKPAGRGLKMTPTPVSDWALKNNIPCLKPEKITPEFIYNLKPSIYNLFIVVAYGKILSEALINTPALGTINIHYSLLPLYRGASPLEACLLNGDEVTGVSIQQMEYKLDSGAILAEEKLEISINETKEEIRKDLIRLGANVLCDILPKIQQKKIIPKKQNEANATFCTKIKKEDGEIDLNGNPRKNWNKYRAFYGWPGAYFFTTKHNKKVRVKIKEAIYENGLFIIKKVIPEGKKEINYEDFLKQN